MSIIPIDEIYFQCQDCGATGKFTVPDDATDDSEIVCNACGKAVCTFGEFDSEVVAKGSALLPDVASELRRGLRGIKGFKAR